MSLLDTVRTAATREFAIGPLVFRIRGVSPMLMAAHGRFQLLLASTPDPETREAVANIARLRAEGADPSALSAQEFAIGTDLMRRRFDPSIQAEEEATRAAILAAGVTHCKAGDEWEPCTVVPDGEARVENGVTLIPYAYLPGAAATADALRDAVVEMSGLTPEVAAAVNRFRGEGGAGAPAGPDGSPVRVPAELVSGA